MSNFLDIVEEIKNNSSIDVRYYLRVLKRMINREIDNFLPSSSFIPILPEAMIYSLTASGKRIRPILAILSYFLSGGRNENVIIPIAVGLEMIHTYTLIHDDLPAMDNDDYRRGKLTSHRVFGEDVAILAGDGLFTYAFDVFLRGSAKPESLLSFLRAVVKMIGLNGVVGGQMLDVYEGKEYSPWLLRRLHYLKTASFISLCCKTGAVLSNNYKLVEPFLRIGKYLGMLFQITDDILDETGGFQQIGKSPGKDRKTHKLTYVFMYGLEGAKRRADRYLHIIETEVNKLGKDFHFFKELAKFIRYREK